MSTLLKVYNHTQPASTTKMEVDTKICSPKQMLKLNSKPDVVDQITLQKALDNRFIHVGMTDYLDGIGSFEQLPKLKIKYETIRTTPFLDLLKATNLSKEYSFGHVKLPKKLRHPYSLFRHSMNDATIIHKMNFQLKGHVVSGIIKQLDFADLSRDDDNGNNEFSLLDDGILMSAGILECKTEK